MNFWFANDRQQVASLKGLVAWAKRSENEWPDNYVNREKGPVTEMDLIRQMVKGLANTKMCESY